MNPTTVFSLRRPQHAARSAAIARMSRCLFAAVALSLPVAGSVRADDPSPFVVTQPVASSVFAITSYTHPSDDPLNPNTAILFGGDNGYEDITDVDGTHNANFVEPTFGNSARLIFTAVPETVPVEDLSTRKFLVGGLFGIAYDFPARNIARIALNGEVDATFVVGSGANNFVTSIVPLTDGSMVVGGLFTSFNGLPRLRVVKLTSTGSVDGAFSASSLIDNDVLALAEGIKPFSSYPGGALQPDGTILVGGTFNHVAGLPITKLARLNSDGTVDATFHPLIDQRVNAIVVQPSGKIIIGGQFTNINGHPVSGIARLNPDGSLDPTFTTIVSGQPAQEPNPVAVYVLKQLSSKGAFGVYVGGNFTQINGTPLRYLGLIDANGAVNTAFAPGAIYDKVQSVFVQADGRVLVGETLGPKIGKTYQPTIIRLPGGTDTD